MNILNIKRMEIVEVCEKEYQNIFDKPYHIFISTPFVECNRSRFDAIHFLFFKESKVRLGIILAEKENVLLSPVSAPYGGFNFTKSNIPISTIESAVELLIDFGKELNKKIEITFPPFFYSSDFLTKCLNVFERSKFQTKYIDLNHQLYLDSNQDYISQLNSNARNKLNGSLKLSYNFFKVQGNTDIDRAYQVIKINRESKGYPLRMTLENVLATIKIIPADFFILELSGIDVAAAQIFHVSKDIVQIIYWGDIPGYGESKPMNYLAYKLYEFYKEKKIKIIDIGPSTEYGIPNYGLCEFKENIGCSVSPKYSFYI